MKQKTRINFWRLALALNCFLVALHANFALANTEKDWAGVCYSAGGAHSPEEVYRDIGLLSQRANILRTYSMLEFGLGEAILDATKAYNMRVYQGLWLGNYDNSGELGILQERINRRQLDNVEAIIVGNETQYRGEFPPDVLIGYIQQVRAMLIQGGYPHIKVTTAEPTNTLSPQLISAVDVVVAHKYPYWEGVNVVDAANNVIQYLEGELGPMAQGKECILGETGWPDQGTIMGVAVPSPENQAYFYSDLRMKSKQPNWQNPFGHKIFYFEGFDSDYKSDPAPAEKHWGIYYPNRTMKPHIRAITADPIVPSQMPHEHHTAMWASSMMGAHLAAEVLHAPLHWLFPHHADPHHHSEAPSGDQ